MVGHQACQQHVSPRKKNMVCYGTDLIHLVTFSVSLCLSTNAKSNAKTHDVTTRNLKVQRIRYILVRSSWNVHSFPIAWPRAPVPKAYRVGVRTRNILYVTSSNSYSSIAFPNNNSRILKSYFGQLVLLLPFLRFSICFVLFLLCVSFRRQKDLPRLEKGRYNVGGGRHDD